MKKILFSLWALGIVVIIACVLFYHGLPVGYDHGTYRGMIDQLLIVRDYRDLPTYILSQFESFYMVFSITVYSFLPPYLSVVWFHLFAYVLVSLAAYITILRHSRSYFLSAPLALVLIFFSLAQYQAYWWGFSKELIATVFMLLAFRYAHRAFLWCILGAVCVLSHRLTGAIFLLVSAVIAVYAPYSQRRWWHVIPFMVGVGGYMPAFSYQVMPVFGAGLVGMLDTTHVSGSLFRPQTFWYGEIPAIGLLIFACIQVWRQGKGWGLAKISLTVSCCIALLMAVRFVGYNRMGVFLDMSLLISLALLLPRVLNKKILLSVVTFWLVMWGWHVYDHQKPDISLAEFHTIESLDHLLPEDSSVVNLDPRMMPWLLAYSGYDIYHPSYGRWTVDSFGKDLTHIRFDASRLCDALSGLPDPVYLYLGSREEHISVKHASCLWEIYRVGESSILRYTE